MDIIIFKALADDTRLRLLNILFRYELSVNELVQILDMGQSRVSRHLKILAETGLLRFRRDGLWVFYSTPVSGAALDFLNAVRPFFPQTPIMLEDLNLAGQILEERARRSRQFFNAIAENWDDLNHEILEDFDLSAKALAAMPEECGTAVDLGCGTGAVLQKLAEKSKKAIGVDGSARMLELCRNRLGAAALANGSVSLRIGELSHLPLADQEADFASINLVLHHLARTDEIFSEIYRILTPAGILFVADFVRHNDENMRLRYGDHRLGFEPDELARELGNSGFIETNREIAPVGKNLKLLLLTLKKNSQG